MNKELNIPLLEVNRYLGYVKDKHTITKNMEDKILLGIDKVKEIANPKVTYQRFSLTRKNDKLFIDDRIELCGDDIKNHLYKCNEVIILSSTLGVQIDSLIRKTELTDMALSIIIDSASNVAIESVCEDAEKEIRKELEKENKFLTSRFSPGYGDFDISIQPEILNLTDAGKKIGLCVNSNYLMIPRKSITAIMGVSDVFVKGKLAGCKTCALRNNCAYRKRGTTCAEN